MMKVNIKNIEIKLADCSIDTSKGLIDTTQIDEYNQTHSPDFVFLSKKQYHSNHCKRLLEKLSRSDINIEYIKYHGIQDIDHALEMMAKSMMIKSKNTLLAGNLRGILTENSLSITYNKATLAYKKIPSIKMVCDKSFYFFRIDNTKECTVIEEKGKYDRTFIGTLLASRLSASNYLFASTLVETNARISADGLKVVSELLSMKGRSKVQNLRDKHIRRVNMDFQFGIYDLNEMMKSAKFLNHEFFEVVEKYAVSLSDILIQQWAKSLKEFDQGYQRFPASILSEIQKIKKNFPRHAELLVAAFSGLESEYIIDFEKLSEAIKFFSEEVRDFPVIHYYDEKPFLLSHHQLIWVWQALVQIKRNNADIFVHFTHPDVLNKSLVNHLPMHINDQKLDQELDKYANLSHDKHENPELDVKKRVQQCWQLWHKLMTSNLDEDSTKRINDWIQACKKNHIQDQQPLITTWDRDDSHASQKSGNKQINLYDDAIGLLQDPSFELPSFDEKPQWCFININSLLHVSASSYIHQKPRKDQNDAIDWVKHILDQGNKSCIVSMPAGQGKSLIIQMLMIHYAKQAKHTLVYIALDDQQVEQFQRDFTVHCMSLSTENIKKIKCFSLKSFKKNITKFEAKNTRLFIDECDHEHWQHDAIVWQEDLPMQLWHNYVRQFKSIVGFSATATQDNCLIFGSDVFLKHFDPPQSSSKIVTHPPKCGGNLFATLRYLNKQTTYKDPDLGPSDPYDIASKYYDTSLRRMYANPENRDNRSFPSKTLTFDEQEVLLRQELTNQSDMIFNADDKLLQSYTPLAKKYLDTLHFLAFLVQKNNQNYVSCEEAIIACLHLIYKQNGSLELSQVIQTMQAYIHSDDHAYLEDNAFVEGCIDALRWQMPPVEENNNTEKSLKTNKPYWDRLDEIMKAVKRCNQYFFGYITIQDALWLFAGPILCLFNYNSYLGMTALVMMPLIFHIIHWIIEYQILCSLHLTEKDEPLLDILMTRCLALKPTDLLAWPLNIFMKNEAEETLRQGYFLLKMYRQCRSSNVLLSQIKNRFLYCFSYVHRFFYRIFQPLIGYPLMQIAIVALPAWVISYGMPINVVVILSFMMMTLLLLLRMITHKRRPSNASLSFDDLLGTIRFSKDKVFSQFISIAEKIKAIEKKHATDAVMKKRRQLKRALTSKVYYRRLYTGHTRVFASQDDMLQMLAQDVCTHISSFKEHATLIFFQDNKVISLFKQHLETYAQKIKPYCSDHLDVLNMLYSIDGKHPSCKKSDFIVLDPLKSRGIDFQGVSTLIDCTTFTSKENDIQTQGRLARTDTDGQPAVLAGQYFRYFAEYKHWIKYRKASSNPMIKQMKSTNQSIKHLLEKINQQASSRVSSDAAEIDKASGSRQPSFFTFGWSRWR